MSRLVVGCDVVDVARMRTLLTEREGARERIFSALELADALRGGVAQGSSLEIERLSARFAAKEATRKALGGSGPPLLDIEVRTAQSGAPQLWLAGQRSALTCSLSHDAGVALAVVVGTMDDLDADLARAD
jgi:phosphopantetheine--protein transferase-like protein